MSNFIKRKNVGRLADVVACLHSGGIVLLPTDTVFGLAVLPTETLGVDRLYALKARPRAKLEPGRY